MSGAVEVKGWIVTETVPQDRIFERVILAPRVQPNNIATLVRGDYTSLCRIFFFDRLVSLLSFYF